MSKLINVNAAAGVCSLWSFYILQVALTADHDREEVKPKTRVESEQRRTKVEPNYSSLSDFGETLRRR